MSSTFVKMAVTRPNAAARELIASGATKAQDVERELHALRAFPAALIGLYRADVAPRWLKEAVASELESVGMPMLT